MRNKKAIAYTIAQFIYSKYRQSGDLLLAMSKLPQMSAFDLINLYDGAIWFCMAILVRFFIIAPPFV